MKKKCHYFNGSIQWGGYETKWTVRCKGQVSNGLRVVHQLEQLASFFMFRIQMKIKRPLSFILTFSDREKRLGSFTSVNIPNADASVDMTRGKDEFLVTEIESRPILALRRMGQLALRSATTESSWIDGRSGIDGDHLAFDFVPFIVCVVQR